MATLCDRAHERQDLTATPSVSSRLESRPAVTRRLRVALHGAGFEQRQEPEA